ncbi:hypothetical protein E2C01_005335 [Portunus trituberculatus]|uniref:Uncharacterized protein n=1 Tax=Portunus trituberculatus TaxID=210409 RepID=A0A5B7CUW5_PORTR|nr:hypothetical protein [Portunus trituberculatus]
MLGCERIKEEKLTKISKIENAQNSVKPKPRRITQADRLLNTPAPLVDKKRITHSSLAQHATKTPYNVV